METTTAAVYHELDELYAYFNTKLFDGGLPPCAITLTRHSKAYGFFLNNSFANRKGDKVPEIALNPDYFLTRTDVEVISTLVHEMCHYYQYLYGKSSRNGYHNSEFAAIMLERGLICSNTGEPGGKSTGQKMTHYIDPNGSYQAALTAFNETHVTEWGSIAHITSAAAKSKTPSKVKYTCSECQQNAWAKPAAKLLCGECSSIEDGVIITMDAELVDSDPE